MRSVPSVSASAGPQIKAMKTADNRAKRGMGSSLGQML
jgi:hypothetical protein